MILLCRIFRISDAFNLKWKLADYFIWVSNRFNCFSIVDRNSELFIQNTHSNSFYASIQSIYESFGTRMCVVCMNAMQLHTCGYSFRRENIAIAVQIKCMQWNIIFKFVVCLCASGTYMYNFITVGSNWYRWTFRYRLRCKFTNIIFQIPRINVFLRSGCWLILYLFSFFSEFVIISVTHLVKFEISTLESLHIEIVNTLRTKKKKNEHKKENKLTEN